jgi:AcrR family transcriptional regulator
MIVSESLVLEREAAPAEADESGKGRQILDGARKVFHSAGFDGASMNEIARVAGVSKGTLYVYFDSKEALFEALIRQDKRAQAEQTCQIEKTGDVRTTLMNIGVRLMSRMLDPELVAQLRTVIAVSSKFPRIGQAYYDAGPSYGHAKLAAYLRDEAAAGHLTVDDFDHAAALFGEMCKAPHLLRAILAVDNEPPSHADLEAHVARAVEAFLKVYGTAKTAT